MACLPERSLIPGAPRPASGCERSSQLGYHATADAIEAPSFTRRVSVAQSHST